MALLSDAPRSATVRAATNGTETIKIEAKAFMALLDRAPDVRAVVEAVSRDRLTQNPPLVEPAVCGNVLEFLLQQGMGNATDMLLIDAALCVHCNNCETACAATHDGISRLDREAGPTFANLHVPISCRHCEHPYCMTDCPPDAIHRSPHGEVFINDSCIGCGSCAHNCPYGVIQLAAKPPRKPGLFGWLRSGLGPSQDCAVSPESPKLAVKCDMCKDLTGGPACVRACPTGAAERVRPEEFFALYKTNAVRWTARFPHP
jgi:Fe-S-cluster-containing hydrogenase component 2